MDTSTVHLQPSQFKKTLGDPYLRLQLEPQTPAALPMTSAKEVIVVPSGRITSMPNMAPYILGLLNQRSRVLWVVDLPQMLGLQPLDPSTRYYNIAIVQAGSFPLGLVVPEVKGVMRVPADLLQSPVGTVALQLVPYLRGCILQPKEIVLVLDAEAIVNSPVLQSSS